MKNYIIIILFFCLLSACNTTTQGTYDGYDFSHGGPVPLKIETEDSKSNTTGECLANTLSFLIGQPETALAAKWSILQTQEY